MYLIDLLLDIDIDQYFDYDYQFQKETIDQKYFKYKDKYYIIIKDDKKLIDCDPCKLRKKCKPIMLVNLKNKEYNLACFNFYKIVEIEDKKRIFEIELNKEYFEFYKMNE